MLTPVPDNTLTSTGDGEDIRPRGRFDPFTESERCVLGEALRELLQVKKEAKEIANADLGSDPRNHFSGDDFGIPEIERMMDELEDEV